MPHKQKKAARRSHATTPQKTLHRCALFALAVTAAVGLLLLLFLSAVLLSTNDPGRYATGAGLAALLLTAMIGGTVCVRLYGRRSPVLCGLLMGACLVVAVSVPSLFHPGTTHASAFLLRTLALPCALLGAFLGAKQKKRRRRR